MMVKITNPQCINYLRENPETNTELVEKAVCRKAGFTPRAYTRKTIGANKQIGNVSDVPVKITDRRVVNYVNFEKRQRGICHRHTVESAILDIICQPAGGQAS